MNRYQPEDLERTQAGGRGRRDFVTLFLADERAPDRRRHGDEALVGIGVLRHDELERCGAAVLADGELRSESGAVVRNPIHVHQLDFGYALLEHRDARFDEPLAFLRGVIFGVLAQVTELTGALNLLGQILRQFLLEHGDFLLESLDQRGFHRRV